MARYIGLAVDDPEEDSERLVAESLKRLPDDWTVLHHVAWQSNRGGRQGDGEADFVLVHPAKGILVVEVKGGGIEIEAGRWFSIDRYGNRHRIKNPYEQAVSSKHVLVAWLRGHGLATHARIGHAVAFPHMQTLPGLGLTANAEISFCYPELAHIDAAIARCYQYWNLEATLTLSDEERLIALLAPTISVSQILFSSSQKAEDEILLLTAEQVEAFAGLRSSRGGLIIGSAGTGKTVLAIARAQQLAKDGFRTLLVCFNELLGNELTKRAGSPPQLIATTYHALCLREANKAKISIPKDRPPSWWENDAPNLLIDACARKDTAFDAIVIDEGQDFSPLWLDSLRCLISGQDGAPFFVFADPLQDIWKRDWHKAMNQSFVYRLNRNMRNTQQIAMQVAASIKAEYRGNGVAGPIPVWHATQIEPSEGDIVDAVEHLITEGFSASAIAVLCDSPSLVSRMRERSVKETSFGRWGSHGIPVETIGRFKGLEAQAIILVLSAPYSDATKVAAYIGMSRARTVLFVLGTESFQQQLGWSGLSSHI